MVQNNSYHMSGVALDISPAPLMGLVKGRTKAQLMCMLEEAGYAAARNSFTEAGPAVFVECDHDAGNHVHVDMGEGNEQSTKASKGCYSCKLCKYLRDNLASAKKNLKQHPKDPGAQDAASNAEDAASHCPPPPSGGKCNNQC